MTPPSGTRRSRLRLAPILALLATCLAGCLTADGTLRADGTGKLTLTYKAAEAVTEASQRALMQAPGITIDSVSIKDRTVSAALSVSDLAGIGKMPLLNNVVVTRAVEGDAGVLTIAVKNKQGQAPRDKSTPGPTIRLTLPGKVLEASEDGVVDGSTVRWSFPLANWLARLDWKLTVRYQTTKDAPADPPAPKAGKTE